MDNLFNHRLVDASDLFDDYFLSAKNLYLHLYNRLPNVWYLNQIDGEKAFELLREKFAARISHVYDYRWHERRKKNYKLSIAIIVLDAQAQCLIEFNGSVCEIYHNGEQPEFINELTAMITPLKERQRREPLEINLVVQDNNRLTLKPMEIKRTKLDLALFYGKDFLETDEIIRKRLAKKKDKGIVLLHGLPGAGKTTYLRYLISKIKKRVLFLSPSVADNLMNPNFVELLTGNPDTVLVIEDAENIIMDRKHNPGSSVSNLLNISDGLLADCLNVQLICTFNSSLTLIDSALLRKGRLIAKHEFGKLNITQSQRLSDHLGYNTVVTKPMTVAEIANQHEKPQEPEQTRTIGFQRQTIEN